MRRDFLLDTSFLSALFPGALKALPAKLAVWVIEHDHRFHLSTVAIAEIVSGVANLERRGALARATAYDRWRAGIVENYDDRVLNFDMAAANVAGRLLDGAVAIGHNPGFADIAIAATASVHNLTVLTRNLKHFVPLGVPAIDPFETLPR